MLTCWFQLHSQGKRCFQRSSGWFQRFSAPPPLWRHHSWEQYCLLGVRCRKTERITHLKHFTFAKSENDIMTMELCSSRANSLFWLLNSIGTAVNQIFLSIHKWSNWGFSTKDLIKGKMSLLHLPPCREATAVRAASLFLETMASLQPLWASRWDTAFPMPLEPPHTTASLHMPLPGELIISREITWLT